MNTTDTQSSPAENADKSATIDGTPANAPADEGKTAEEKINWLAELRGLALMLLAVLAFHSLVAKPFYIPSTSMMPTLHVGDRLIVSKYPYGWSWASASFHLLPRGEWRVWGSTPEYGDIVIPVHPYRDEDYIKRVVGLPGDLVEVRRGLLYLNGAPVKREQVADIRIPFEPELMCISEGIERECLHSFNAYRKTDADGQIYFDVPAFRETLPNGASYLIIDHLQFQQYDNYGPYPVPEGSVFVMGDNRDHSADSRAPTNPVNGGGLEGAVPLENIGGRAEFITFSLDGSATWNPFSWWSALREGRAWTTLRPAIAEQEEASE